MPDGLYGKYEVYKAGGGSIVEECFVLRPDRDRAARVAVLAYADHTPNATLARELREWIAYLDDPQETT